MTKFNAVAAVEIETSKKELTGRMCETGNPTYVLDCIDDVKTKCALLEAVTRKHLKVITATGAGAKADPTRLQIGTLKDAVRTLHFFLW